MPFDPKKNEASAQYDIWRSMRVLRRFTLPELVSTVTTTTQKSIYTYVWRLKRAAYLASDRPKKTERTVFRLLRDTGPYAPMLRRDGTVYDANKKAVFGEVRQ